MLIVICQFSSNQALMAHNKGNHNKCSKNNPKPHTQGSNNFFPNASCSASSNNSGNAPSNASNKKVYETCKYCGKFHTKKFC